MAKADWQRRPSPTPPATFTLELSEDEALEIAGFLGNVTGPENAADSAFGALVDALVASGRKYGEDIMQDPAFVRGAELPTLV